MQILDRPGDFSKEAQGRNGQERVLRNLSRGALVQKSIENNECVLLDSGAIVVNTGKFTGRSPKDKYIAQYGISDEKDIHWGEINKPISPEAVANIYEQMIRYSKQIPLYIQDLIAGKDSQYSISLKVITETAWLSLFSKNLFKPKSGEDHSSPDFVIYDFPQFTIDPQKQGLNSGTFIILDFEKGIVLIGGTAYAGELKKAVFTILNKLLPEKNMLPMHCSANMGTDGSVALFFGLSGTGKTTLSSVEDRCLIGDDEHGWSDAGVFNFENGCYAKTIGIKKELEPQIYSASTHFGTVLENVVIEPKTHEPIFSDASITENTRAAYPIAFIDGTAPSGQGGHPNHIFFLSADAFGVLPPISRLNEDQAMDYFLAGFTAKLAGTELGLSKEPTATFSTCFAAPFLPLHPKIYANLLKEKIQKHHTQVWLINTGWSGGSYGTGSRIKLPYTRAMIRAAINGELAQVDWAEDEMFHLSIPVTCPDVPSEILNPINTWQDREMYITQSQKLLGLFEENRKTN